MVLEKQIKNTPHSTWRPKWSARIIQFVALFAFWILLSGRFEIKYLVIGLFASGFVTYLTGDLLYSGQYKRADFGSRHMLASAWRLFVYAPWLVWAIIKANIQVAVIILKPRMPIDPGWFQFSTQLKGKVSKVTLANSITLTPGTITADMKQSKMIIHFIVPESASDLVSGVMQNKVGAVFEEKNDIPQGIKWAYSNEELTHE
jgi:multicomponent Na+:H+ antiporter subunit E